MSRKKFRLNDKLSRLQQNFESLKNSITHFDFICPGSVVKRYIPCGKSNCRCSTDSRFWHGPYYEWSRKVRGKTVTVRLSEHQAALYSNWTNNDRNLMKLFRQMRVISMQAALLLVKGLVIKDK